MAVPPAGTELQATQVVADREEVPSAGCAAAPGAVCEKVGPDPLDTAEAVPESVFLPWP